MHVDDVELRERPFNRVGPPTTFVQYGSQRKAFKFLRNVLTDNRGIGLLHGPRSSGKSVLVEQFVQEMQTNPEVAVVNGARLKPEQFLSRILAQFGYDLEETSAEELLNILNVFAVQQTRAHQAPLLVFENINEMYPSSLRVVCRLASLSANNLFAFRIVLTSNSDFRRIITSPSMSAVARRMTGDFELQPLTSNEAKNYLYSKLKSCGVERPDDVFPVDTCDKIYSASGGWPGQLDDIALSIMETSTVTLSTSDESADDLPVLVEEFDYPEFHVDDESPRLVVTCGGKTLQDIVLVDTRALIGRADLCDIIISDQFISKQHALLIREQNVVILVDLKSANGKIIGGRYHIVDYGDLNGHVVHKR